VGTAPSVERGSRYAEGEDGRERARIAVRVQEDEPTRGRGGPGRARWGKALHSTQGRARRSLIQWGDYEMDQQSARWACVQRLVDDETER